MSTPALRPSAPRSTRWSGLRLVGGAALVLVVLAGGLVATVDLLTTAFYWPNALLGGFLIARRPRMVIGWVILVVGFGSILTSTPSDLDIAGLVDGTAGWRDFIWLWFSQWGGGLSFAAYLALALLFPTDRFLPGRLGTLGRWLLVASLVLVPLAAVLPIVRVDTISPGASEPIRLEIANRVGLPMPLPLAELIGVASLLVPMLGLFVVGPVTLRARYRRGDATTRFQLRGFTAAMTAVIGAIVFGLVVTATLGWTVWAWVPAMATYSLVPASIVVAVTRHRLWDIDRIISRTLAYAVLTAALAAVFVALIAGLQAVLVDVTRGDTLPVAVSTLVVFALFQPLRRRIQTVVDRRFDRAKVDAERTTTAFGGRLRDQLDLPTLTGDLRRTVGGALQPNGVTVWIRGAGLKR